MKQKSLPRFFSLSIATFSLAAFLFVNIHAGLAIPQTIPGAGLEQPKLEDCDNTQSPNKALPGVAVLVRFLELAHRFVPSAD